MERSKYIPVEIAEEIVNTLWELMDSEWTPARDAYNKCIELIDENTVMKD